jgi:hypothetical protein
MGRYIRANHPGKCACCGQRYPSGEEIARRPCGWVLAVCVSREQTIPQIMAGLAAELARSGHLHDGEVGRVLTAQIAKLEAELQQRRDAFAAQQEAR